MPIDPAQHYIHLAPNGDATVIPGGDRFWAQPEVDLDRWGHHWLITEFECNVDWPNWERHPNADEFVYLLSGSVDMWLERTTGVEKVSLSGRGAVLVPRGVWHTAKVHAPSRMLFVTLGAGTEHRPVTAEQQVPEATDH